MTARRLLPLLLLLPGGPAFGHASEQSFVLLLPTDVYAGAGVAAVAATVLLLAVLPPHAAGALFRPLPLWHLRPARGRTAVSLVSFAVLAALIGTGLLGPRDPLGNPLPLAIWTIWWIGLVALQGLLGDFWGWINPWTGPLAVTRTLTQVRAPLRYPRRLGFAPAVVSFLGFAAVLLADPAPSDPARLARMVAGYWLYGYLGGVLFGPVWLLRGEGLTVLMRAYARLAAPGRVRGRRALGLPGWRLLRAPPVPVGLAVFVLLMLGSGSFDGLNETFWWYGVLGLNPLEYPGRTALILPTLAGLLAANAALVAAFALCVRAGLRLARANLPLAYAFRLFAPAILPIALGYHIGHYLTALLVDGQYVLAWASDPLLRGADLLGLGPHPVSTGFLNRKDSVRTVFLAQAGAVVAGHVLAVLLAHAQAVRIFGGNRRAALSQAPLAGFMVLYTLFGLWLLASPRAG
ncbi:hypothetical protein GE300_03635 [Rhodobacteraceae bacterium 2CG4]|uniref:Fenitrothion hydrolase n=1 Tax=Halovulum marinum TaxID=2662447 RepID=A0A6L5YWM5_9RHOB|nr:hypothetical protein [Halovulum marinum]MSU88711.1 hypothetical protein [Halovulum marinum]